MHHDSTAVRDIRTHIRDVELVLTSPITSSLPLPPHATAYETACAPPGVTPSCTAQVCDPTLQATPFDAHPLPYPTPMAGPSFVWAECDAETFAHSLSAAYTEVVKWKPNTFSIPFGNSGKKFVQELSRLFRAYAEGSALESVALKAITVMSILLLQRPARNSKTKDHSSCLERRLHSWQAGDINGLVLEGRCLQKRLPKTTSRKRCDENLVRSFSNLMFNGKTSAALDLLSLKGKGGVLHTNDPANKDDPASPSVLDVLKSKHPPAQPATATALFQHPQEPPEVHPVVYDSIDAKSIRSAALNTRGAAGPSGLDAHCWRRLCCSFHSASWDLCHSLAMVARRLCVSLVDPNGLSAFLACRLIALDKCPGVRPIGICECARRIISKAILVVTKGDVQEVAGSLQLCAGQIAGIETAVHFMSVSFQLEDTEAVLLVDASNAFNSLNRDAALHNIRHICPSLATVLINTYREATELFVEDTTLFSEEGTTQGDPLAMPMYALATVPLINRLNVATDLKQVWYADDAAASGSLSSLRVWWDHLSSLGPAFGYHANANKTWLLTKEDHLSRAKDLFGDTLVNITTHGRPHLGAPLGSNEFLCQFVTEKVNQWTQELLLLSDIAKAQPHAAYAALTHGYTHKFSFLCRTTPNIEDLLGPLEDCIRHNLIPSLTGRAPPSNLDRNLFALPARLGGLGIVNPTLLSTFEFNASVSITSPLSNLIATQCQDYPYDCVEAQYNVRKSVQQQRHDNAKASASDLRKLVPESLQRAMDLAEEKGVSSWLTSLPLEEFNLVLHKGAFRDALALRYGWLPSNLPTHCSCGANFSVQHALSCPKGGFPILRHNEVRDLTANIMAEVCHDVCIEQSLQPLTGETLSGASAKVEDGARLDIAASGFWGGRHDRAFFDVRVFNPHATSNQQPIATCYRKHENSKKRDYEQRVREIERGSFTPLVLSLTGGLGNAAKVCYSRLASMLATKRDQPYSSTMSWLRCTLSFCLLRSSIRCIRGTRSTGGRAAKQQLPPADLVTSEARFFE